MRKYYLAHAPALQGVLGGILSYMLNFLSSLIEIGLIGENFRSKM